MNKKGLVKISNFPTLTTPMSNPEERTTDELSKHILKEMEKPIRDKKNAEQKDKAKALTMIKKVFVDTKQALDVAYSAGVLASKTQGHAQEESLRFSANLPDKQMRGELSRARKRVEQASTKIDELLETKYKDAVVPADTKSFFYHWLEAD